MIDAVYNFRRSPQGSNYALSPRPHAASSVTTSAAANIALQSSPASVESNMPAYMMGLPRPFDGTRQKVLKILHMDPCIYLAIYSQLIDLLNGQCMGSAAIQMGSLYLWGLNLLHEESDIQKIRIAEQ